MKQVMKVNTRKLSLQAAAQPSSAPSISPVEFDDWSVLAVPDHGGLHDLAEGRLLRRRHQQRPQRVDPHPVGVQIELVRSLQRMESWRIQAGTVYPVTLYIIYTNVKKELSN